MNRRATTLVLTATAMLSACDGSRAQTGHRVSNVDGLRVVESLAPSWRPEEAWRLSDAPAATVGVLDGAPEYLLDRVVGVATRSGGDIAVADLGSSRIRWFDPSGRFVSEFGSKGEGPGEFRQPLGLYVFAEDSIAVLDRLERVHFFGPEGRFVRTVPLGTTPVDVDPVTLHELEQYHRIVGFVGAGSFVSRTASQIRLVGEGRRLEEAQAPELTFALHGPDGSVLRTLAQLSGPTFAPHPENLILPTVFGSNVYAGVTASELVLGVASGGEIRWIDQEGRARQVASRDWARTPVTDAMFDRGQPRCVRRRAGGPVRTAEAWTVRELK